MPPTSVTFGAPAVSLADLHAKMALIRAFELRVSTLYRDGDIPGFVHTSLGQEAIAAGVCAALEHDDYLTTTHRGHGHVLAKGADLDGMMAELFGRADGLCRGKGGSMHVADPSVGILGANAIVGAGIPLAVGAGLSSKLLGQGRVAVAFFGEGAVNQGAFHEAANLAAIWNLPVILLCEDNRYAEFTDSTKMTRVASVCERAAAYGIWARDVYGNDVAAVHAVTREAVERCRAGQGPALIEAATYRWHGHYEGDDQPYKPGAEADEWRTERDPLVLAEAVLVADGIVTEAELAAVRTKATERVDRAVVAARAAAVPAEQEAFQHVFVD